MITNNTPNDLKTIENIKTLLAKLFEKAKKASTISRPVYYNRTKKKHKKYWKRKDSFYKKEWRRGKKRIKRKRNSKLAHIFYKNINENLKLFKRNIQQELNQSNYKIKLFNYENKIKNKQKLNNLKLKETLTSIYGFLFLKKKTLLKLRKKYQLEYEKKYKQPPRKIRRWIKNRRRGKKQWKYVTLKSKWNAYTFIKKYTLRKYGRRIALFNSNRVHKSNYLKIQRKNSQKQKKILKTRSFSKRLKVLARIRKKLRRIKKRKKRKFKKLSFQKKNIKKHFLYNKFKLSNLFFKLPKFYSYWNKKTIIKAKKNKTHKLYVKNLLKWWNKKQFNNIYFHRKNIRLFEIKNLIQFQKFNYKQFNIYLKNRNKKIKENFLQTLNWRYLKLEKKIILNTLKNIKYKNFIKHFVNSTRRMNKDIIRKFLKSLKKRYFLRNKRYKWRNKRDNNRKNKRIRKIKLILKKKYTINHNVESNPYTRSYTIISNEFFNSSKFKKIKPHIFTLKINKFIKHFF